MGSCRIGVLNGPSSRAIVMAVLPLRRENRGELPCPCFHLLIQSSFVGLLGQLDFRTFQLHGILVSLFNKFLEI